MDRSAAKLTPNVRANGSKILPARYGAKWLEPVNVNNGRKSDIQYELSQSLPLGDVKHVEPQRRISSVYSKRSWPPKPVLKSYKSMDESPSKMEEKVFKTNENTHNQKNGGDNKPGGKATLDSRFYEHFQEPSPHRPVISARTAKPSPHPRTKHIPPDSPGDSLRSSGYSSFDTPQPYHKPKPLGKSVRAEMTASNERPQSENSFFDTVKDYKNDLKINVDQRTPASKTMVKVLGQGLSSGAAIYPGLDERSKSDDKLNGTEESCATLKCWSLDKDRPRQSFAHYDWQSTTFTFANVLIATETLKRKNETTGASKAAALSVRMHSNDNTPAGSYEDLQELKLSGSTEDVRTNDVLEWCPFFVNEIGGETDEAVFTGITDLSTSSQTPAVSVQLLLPENSSHSITNSPTTARMLLVNNKGVSVMEKIGIADDKQLNAVGFIQEYLDHGALYYRKHFFEQDHQNFFGIDDKYGPVAISMKREKLRESAASIKENAWNYRVIVRASELCTLRGSVLEDVLGSQHYSTTRALKPRDVLEYTAPEINFDCLKSAPLTEAVQKQLMKVDEQNVANSYKIGIMYCKKGQTKEEQMYNNEYGSPGFEEFLDLLGDKIQLKGFDKFRGGLDVKTNSTGKESYFTTFQGIEIMFHVSTLLPYTPNNAQQLLRKRHIGNDIVTIVFQEPDSPPFSAQNIRSHFQHVFIVIRVHQPCSSRTCYRIAVTRSQDIPSFGPLIPKDALFPKSETFRDFLLTKLLNGERAARSAGKFKAMSMNTRQEYLRDLAINHTSQAGLDASPKFTRFSLTAASRRVIDREKSKNKPSPEELALGALVWHVILQDCTTEGIPCMLCISDYMFLLVRKSTGRIIFSIPCQAVIGWAEFSGDTLHIYYGRGERIAVRAFSCATCNWKHEVKSRLQTFSIGCETKTKSLRRNVRGQLGFHINYEGIVMDVEANGYAHSVGLTQGSRLVEICKVLVVTMTHAEVLDLLRTSEVVTVIMILPLEDGTPRRCSKSLYHVSPVLKMIEINSEASKYISSDEDSMLHSRSKSDPAFRTKLNKSLEDVKPVSAQSLKLNLQSARDWNLNSSASNSAASTPTTSLQPVLNKFKMRQTASLDPAVPLNFRAMYESRDYVEGRAPHTSRPNHFTTMPLKNSKEKSYMAGGGMKHSTSIESGLNLSSYDYNKRGTRPVKPQNLQPPVKSISAFNTPVTTPTSSSHVFPSRFSIKSTSHDKAKPVIRPKPFKVVQRDPVVTSVQSSRHYMTAPAPKTRERFSGQSQPHRSTSTESGLDSNTNMEEIDGTKTTPTRRKKHTQQSRPLNGTQASRSTKEPVLSNTRHHPKYIGSPQVERRQPKDNFHSWRNDDWELKNQADDVPSTIADSRGRSAFHSRHNGQAVRAVSPGREEVFHSCASDYCSDDGQGSTTRPRSASSMSPVLPSGPSSEESSERLSRISTDTDADVRLRKIEDALKSLQSQLAKEQRSKRRILKEVEKLRKDNQRLQKQASTQGQKRDMTYA